MSRFPRDDEWEDADSDLDHGRGASPKNAFRGLRKRSQSSRPYSPRVPSKRPARSGVTSHLTAPQRQWNQTAASASRFTVNYIVEVVRLTLIIFHRPLAIMLFGYLVILLCSHIYATYGASLMVALNPLCYIPIVSRLPLCHLSADRTHIGIEGRTTRRVDYPNLTGIQIATFDELLDGSISGARLGLEMKKAEIATSDLTTLVRASQLTVHDSLADALSQFGVGAKRAGRGLQLFGAKVGGAADRIISMNDYTLRRIESEDITQWPPRSLLLTAFIPFSRPSRSVQPPPLITLFNQGMAALASELRTLILAAESSIRDLDELEELLKVVHTIASLEESAIVAEKDALLAQLWTMLGGNRQELQLYDSHLELLNDISECRKHALAHVIGTLQTLQGMSADLEALRERAMDPVLYGDDAIPLEVHIRSIKKGVERLTADRTKAKVIESAHYAAAGAVRG